MLMNAFQELIIAVLTQHATILKEALDAHVTMVTLETDIHVQVCGREQAAACSCTCASDSFPLHTCITRCSQ